MEAITEPTDKTRVVCRILEEPVIIKGFHIFGDGWDEYVLDEKEAYKIYNEACKEYDNVRLYEFYEEEEGMNVWDGDCLEAKGGFPS